MSKAFFDQVVDALVGFLPPERRQFSSRVTGRNVKVWFGEEAREHFEVQALPSGKLEVGFHAEHADAARNQQVLDSLLTGERRWRRGLGADVKTGPFPGAPTGAWRRASEVWEGPGLREPEAAIEAADRLADYIRLLGPLLDASAKPP